MQHVLLGWCLDTLKQAARVAYSISGNRGNCNVWISIPTSRYAHMHALCMLFVPRNAAATLTTPTLTMASKFEPALALPALLLIVASFVSCKGGKKSEETISFDVKPSGQLVHETLKLVRSCDAESLPLTYPIANFILYTKPLLAL